MFSLVNFYSVCISSQFMLLDIKKALFPTSFCLALKSSGGHQCILEWQNQLNNRVTGAYGRASQPRGIYLWSPHSSRLLFASRGGPPRMGGCFECRFSGRSLARYLGRALDFVWDSSLSVYQGGFASAGGDFHFWGRTERQAIIIGNFEIFLIFSKVVESYV